MTFLKKASMALIAASMVTAPVAASAQTAQFGDLRANTTVTNAATMGEGGESAGATSWILALLAAAAVIAGIIIAADGSNDSPTSP